MPALSPYTNATGQGLGPQVVAYASRFLGVPYVYGGVTPQGFDCSGLVQYVFKNFGVRLPRTSQEQANVGIPIARKEDLAVGDLVISNGAGHVAIYAGDGMVIEAPRPGKRVQLAPLVNNQFVRGVRLPGVVPGVTGSAVPAATGGPVTTQVSTQVTPIGIHIPGTPWDIPTPGDAMNGIEGAAASIGRALTRFAIMTPFVLGGVALLVVGAARSAGIGKGS